MEGEVFIALGTSHGDFEPPRASISPQSPPSLKPGNGTKMLPVSDKKVNKEWGVGGLASWWLSCQKCKERLDVRNIEQSSSLVGIHLSMILTVLMGH